jgi:hypothetical protein
MRHRISSPLLFDLDPAQEAGLRLAGLFFTWPAPEPSGAAAAHQAALFRDGRVVATLSGKILTIPMRCARNRTDLTVALGRSAYKMTLE